jgi:hypothetical protein
MSRWNLEGYRGHLGDYTELRAQENKSLFMTLLILFLTVFSSAAAQADIISRSQSCEIELVQVGRAITTPLQQEAEWVLQQKGFTLIRKNPSLRSEDSVLRPFVLQVQYSAGNDSLSDKSDCLVEDYHELGKRFTCQYELTFLVNDSRGGERAVFRLRQSIRQSLEVRSFYDQVRSELAQLPQCTQL